MIVTSSWFTPNPENRKEHVFPGSAVQPDQAMSIREIIDRFTRGVPAIGKVNMNFDQDAESLMNQPYVFPDDPDFADYVYAERHFEQLRAAHQQQLLDAQTAQQAAAAAVKTDTTSAVPD